MGQLRTVRCFPFHVQQKTYVISDRLTNAEHVIVIGHGPGAQHVMNLMNRRGVLYPSLEAFLPVFNVEESCERYENR